MQDNKQDTQKSTVVHWRMRYDDAKEARRQADEKGMTIGRYVGSLVQAAGKRVSK